jgi:hypothetical protein
MLGGLLSELWEQFLGRSWVSALAANERLVLNIIVTNMSSQFLDEKAGGSDKCSLILPPEKTARNELER